MKLKLRLIASALALALAAPIAAATDDCGDRRDFARTGNLTVIGLTADQRLVRFRACNPDHLRHIGAIYGLQSPDTSLIGIDFRVQDGLLYGVGNRGGIYTIDTKTAAAMFVSQLTVPLAGAFFGVDFNPAANALRIVSDAGQNLRHPFAGPLAFQTQTDTALNYTAGTTATGITGAAYTNNDLDPNTSTTLFDIDTLQNQVVIQVPPNNGTLVLTGKLTVDADSPVGFDMYTRLRDGVAVSNSGFASLVVGGMAGFYRIDMLTGRAVLIDNFYEQVIDVALPLDQ